MLHKPEASNQLVLTLEQFIRAAEAFIQSHYEVGSDREDIQKILRAMVASRTAEGIANLQLDVDNEELEKEFGLNQEKKDLMADYFIKF